MNETFMKEKPILPLLTSMALPMVISMMVNALYNIVDSLFVARINENAMTALSLVFPIQNFVNALAIGFGVGINALIAYFLGAGDKKGADRAATQGLVLALIHGVVVTVLSISIMPAFLDMFTNDVQVYQMGMEYAVIVFAFSTITMANLSFEKIFQSVGRMKVSMIGLLCGSITNIILDPLLIFGIGIFPRLGIAGAAIATAIGQLCTLLLYLTVYNKRPIPVKIRKEYLAFHKETDHRLYSIGVPAILNLALPSLLVSVLNGILAAYSQIYVVILGIYYACDECCHYGARHNFMPGGIARSDGTVHRKCRDDRSRRNRTAHHQCRLYHLLRVRHSLRRLGGAWKRNAVPCHIAVPLCNSHDPGSLCIVPYLWTNRSMACFLDHRSSHLGHRRLYLP